MNTPTIIVVDRLHLSNIVYPSMLRPQNIIDLHGSFSNYLLYTKTFETYIQDMAHVELITFFTHSETAENDNENPKQSILAQHINESNTLFVAHHELSLIKNKYLIEIEYDEKTKQYDTSIIYFLYLPDTPL